MDTHINHLIDKIRTLEDQLEVELAAKRADLAYRIEGQRIIFEETVVREHARVKTKLLKYILGARLFMILTAPFIYAVLIPIVLLDALVSLYQCVCFPVYGIPKVTRGNYMIFDRANLNYLNAIEKINCAYCSYGNGVISYAREVASRTEQYWCPIKHARRVLGAHARYSSFIDFGDATAYHDRLEPLRSDLQKETPPATQNGDAPPTSST
ncbi:MAG: hypothetical protein WC043_03310 [Pseudobdellovibrionaceae bacterium]